MTEAAFHRHEIVLAGNDLKDLVAISLQLDPLDFAISVIDSPEPLEYVLRHVHSVPAVMVLKLTGDEHTTELRAFCEAFSESAIVFLTTMTPISHARGRVIEGAGAIVMSASESPLAVVASALALSFQRAV